MIIKEKIEFMKQIQDFEKLLMFLNSIFNFDATFAGFEINDQNI
jgi:hypothetical protein